jgi:hypothetical protein
MSFKVFVVIFVVQNKSSFPVLEQDASNSLVVINIDNL